MRHHPITRALLVACVALAACVPFAVAEPERASVDGPARVCFPAAQWGPAPDRLRPCARVAILEDGGIDARCVRGCVYADRRSR